MNINILGFGLMAKQIAALLYLLGHNITIWNHKTVNLELLEKTIKLVNRVVKSNNLGSINVCDKIIHLNDNLTIEAVVEDIDIKRELHQKLINIVSTGNYFTNSSSYSPNEIDESVGGMHFYNPIYAINMVELYCPIKSSAIFEVESSLLGAQFEIIYVKSNRGYVGNYILFHEISSALKLIEKHGYTIETISKVYNQLYAGRDIFTVIDLIGIDIVHKIIENLKVNDDSIYLPQCLQKAIELNILGKKNKSTIKSCL